jgi:hypothetical protein
MLLFFFCNSRFRVTGAMAINLSKFPSNGLLLHINTQYAQFSFRTNLPAVIQFISNMFTVAYCFSKVIQWNIFKVKVDESPVERINDRNYRRVRNKWLVGGKGR